MSRGRTDQMLIKAYADDSKAGTKHISEDHVKAFISHLVSSKKNETQLQNEIRKLSVSSSDTCVAYIKRRQNEARASSRETSIKILIDSHIVSNRFLVFLIHVFRCSFV